MAVTPIASVSKKWSLVIEQKGRLNSVWLRLELHRVFTLHYMNLIYGSKDRSPCVLSFAIGITISMFHASKGWHLPGKNAESLNLVS